MTKGFTVYPEYWKAIEHLDDNTKKDICLALINYGINEELPNAADNPIAFAMISAWKMALDNSIDNHKKASTNGNKGGRPAKTDYSCLGDWRREGITAPEAAKRLGVSVDTIYNRKEWKEAAPTVSTNKGFDF